MNRHAIEVLDAARKAAKDKPEIGRTTTLRVSAEIRRKRIAGGQR
jgi:hypothetical protein